MGTNILLIMGSTAVIYVALLIGLRLLGKKGIGQLTLTDVLFVMLITEGAGDAMHMGDQSLPGALISIVTLIIVNKLFEWFLYRYPKFRRFVDGVFNMWNIVDLGDKRRLQNMVFPEGIIYNKETSHIEPLGVNKLFIATPCESSTNNEKENGQTDNYINLSAKAPLQGLEPWTP